VICGLLNCIIFSDLDRTSRSFLLVLSEISFLLLLHCLIESPGYLTKDYVGDYFLLVLFEGHFLDTISGVVCISKVQQQIYNV